MTETTELQPYDSVTKLARDLRAAAATLSDDEARFLVDAYYAMQEDRIRAGNQVRALNESGEPHEVLTWLSQQNATLETNIKAALGKFADARPVGVWSQLVPGIGPIIAAGLLAHIDIEKAPTVGHIWRFAGLDPSTTWDKGKKRPWNSRLKTLCWKIGESFVKVKANESDVYGKIYTERKKLEVVRNLRGEFADQADVSLATKNFGRDTEARAWYSGAFAFPEDKLDAVADAWTTDPELFRKMMATYRVDDASGKKMLPPARIHLRAKRYAVKLFLAHWHHVAYLARFGTAPVKPYVIEHGGHVHFIEPPYLADAVAAIAAAKK